MPRIAVCTVPGCPTLVEGGGRRCPVHAREADRARGTAAEREYATAGHQRFRLNVLTLDPICTCTDDCPDHGPQCLRISTVADHHPRSRRDLVDAGLDPNDPNAGRGLCKRCHDRHTARAQPGGWAAAR